MAAALAAGCAGADGSPRVLAAASLTDVLPLIDDEAGYSFGGSAELATQVREGAPADVFVSADPDLARRLAARGILTQVRRFGGNRLVIAVPSGDPASVRSPAGLDREGTRLVVAQPGVPVGDYARRALRRLGLESALDNVVSEERDTRSALAKVALGEADAAIVYATDVQAAGGDVQAISLPPEAQPEIRYAVGLLTDAADGRRFVDRLTGPEGERILRSAGFGAP
ncbi:MAG: molybdate ABC transporter substrate-binding protein [Miltoncostaeaceae bacterium]